ncbi:FAD synthase [Candidatus Woesearchaeota archaeon]|nr:FAD synthase [Candidatus Woesearchaeota archaeon]
MKKVMCISWLSFFAAPKKVMCFGTFDVLHEGHRFYLSEAKKLGDYLVVVVARDETVKKVKEKQPLHSESERVRHLKQLGIADKVVLGNPGDKLKVVEDERPQVICLGYDQTFFTDKIKEKLQERGVSVDIVRMPAYKPEMYKSSLLREK